MFEKGSKLFESSRMAKCSVVRSRALVLQDGGLKGTRETRGLGSAEPADTAVRGRRGAEPAEAKRTFTTGTTHSPGIGETTALWASTSVETRDYRDIQQAATKSAMRILLR